MGTSTVYLKHNDYFGNRLDRMTKKELKELSKLSPYGKKRYFRGWSVPLELHNGNVHVLVWWKGRLMRVEDAPNQLSRKYYDKYRGKKLNEYEWTVFRRFALNLLNELDKMFKKQLRKNSKQKLGSLTKDDNQKNKKAFR